MRFGINALLLSETADYRQSGVSRYIAALLNYLPPLLNQDELLAWLQPGVDPPTRTVEVLRGNRLTNRASGRILWEQAVLPAHARRQKLDLFHGPVNTLPRLTGVPTVVTIHDLAFLRWPEHLPRGRREWLQRAVPASARLADRIIVPSQATARDVQQILGIDPTRITVIPLAVDARFHQIVASKRMPAGSPYILAVGTLEPRKNLPSLLTAFRQILDQIPHRLVIAGATGWSTGEIEAAGNDPALRGRVEWLGFVPPENLPALYAGADLFVMPSLYEGFGLPLLEAMTVGTPAAASLGGSLPELGEKAVTWFDPTHSNAIAEAILTVLQDDDLASRQRVAGMKLASSYSWHATAAATLRVYQETAR